MLANTMIEPVTQYDKAVFLQENIKEDILKYCKNDFTDLSAKEYLIQVKHSFYRDDVSNKFPEYEKQRIRIFRAINLDGDAYGTAINLLEILEL